MGFFEGLAGVVAIAAIFVILPKTILSFIQKNADHKREIELEKLRYQKEMMELELEKQRNQLKLLEAENKNLDKIINNDSKGL
jgi:hypothetical protein